MSFINITDPRKRDEIVQAYLATKKRIQQSNYNERIADLTHEEELQKLFQPMVTSTERSAAAIQKELDPIRTELKDLNSKVSHKRADIAVKKEDDDGIDRDSDMEEESIKNLKRMPTLDSIMKKYNILSHHRDRYFAIQKVRDNYMMGTKKVTFDADANIYVDNEKYVGTEGLWNLIMLAKPIAYEPEDVEEYLQLVKQTNVKDHPHISKGRTRPRATSKWRNILTMLHQDKDNAKEGEGIIYLPSTIKAMEDKLKVLLAEYNAGNQTSTRNEIVPIADALLKRKAITRGEYKDINSFLSSTLQ